MPSIKPSGGPEFIGFPFASTPAGIKLNPINIGITNINEMAAKTIAIVNAVLCGENEIILFIAYYSYVFILRLITLELNGLPNAPAVGSPSCAFFAQRFERLVMHILNFT